MVKRASSSVAGDASDTQSLLPEDDRPILVSKIRPKLFGINVTFIMFIVYLCVITTFVLHLALVMGCSFRIKGGYVITLTFGILGPIPLVYWILAIMYAIYGAVAFFYKHRDYWAAASLFRRWTRVSRYLLLALVSAYVNLFFGSRMFVYGTSLEYHVNKHMKTNKITGLQQELSMAYSKLHDELVSSQVNMHQPYPLNILISLSVNWGLWSVALIFPPLVAYVGILAQEAYYTWRFGHTGIKID